MKNLEHADMIMKLAYEDWNALKGMKDTERLFSDGIFGFHAQQAIEKALKAWLCHLGKEYPKTHDIRLLLMLLSSSGEKIDSYWPLVEYNIYAVQSRYEYIAENEPFKRPQVIQQIERLLNKIKKIISN